MHPSTRDYGILNYILFIIKCNLKFFRQKPYQSCFLNKKYKILTYIKKKLLSSHLDNINQTRNSAVKIEHDLKYMNDALLNENSKKSPNSNVMSKTSTPTTTEKTADEGITSVKSSTLIDTAVSAASSSSLADTDATTSAISTDSNGASPDVRQRRLQHFQSNATTSQ